MAKISIKHIGSLKEIELEIKRINVFMGPQSTGKSTIAKIISQALWAEKNFITTGDEYDFYKGLLGYHNMDKNYFNNSNAEIVYDSDWCIIKMEYKEGKRTPKTSYKKKEHSKLYHNTKIEYIPAERNFVANIKDIMKYKGPNNSLTSFLFDWYEGKSSYQRRKSFDIELPDLSFSYRYKEGEDQDIIKIEDTEIDLQSSSSGQQSLLPLMIVSETVMVSIYNTQRMFSLSEIEHIKKKAPELSDLLSELGKKAKTKTIEKKINELWKKIGYKADYGCTHLVIEEPEQNLYPSTQRGLLKHLVSYLSQDSKHQHTLTITTHSPYILYALNNCMIAGIVKEKNHNNIEKLSFKSVINPTDVGLWELKDGKILSLQDTKTLLLTQDLFNNEFHKNNEEMFKLLKLIPYETASKGKIAN